MKKRSRRYLPFLLIFAGIFIWSAYQAGNILYRSQKEDAAFSALIEQAEQRNSVPNHRRSELPHAFLKEQNPDFFAWVSVPGTKLDYPVMYTPEQPEYYLRRAFDQSDSLSGTPFVGEGYREDGNHTVIYGHNMKNGTMFSTLLSYAEKNFWEQHPVVVLETSDALREYRVLGAFYTELYPKEEEDVFRFYQCNDLREQSDFERYTRQVRQFSLYDTGVTAEYGGQLLTLVTCSPYDENERFVLVAYCKEEE